MLAASIFHDGDTTPDDIKPPCKTTGSGCGLMIILCIDLQGGQTVQLVGGEKKAIDAGDLIWIAERFALAGEIAVIDLDAAMRSSAATRR